VTPENLFSLAELMQTMACPLSVNPNLSEAYAMVNRKRNIQLKIWLTEEERRLIDEKMKLLPTSQIGAYIRKMAIDGYIIYTDTANIKEMNKELRAIGRNINQIAKRVNSTGDIYRGDITELRERLGEIWQLQRTILSTLR
jgi:hypothetical protein